MKTLRIVTLAGLLATGIAGTAHADALTDRQDIMKGIGDATRPIGGMLKGEAPFDLATVKAALATYATGAPKMKALFPENSRTGKTEASPRIWSEKDKVDALFDKLAADSTAASATITDQASFKANIGKVLGNCKACHDDYRVKK